MLPACASPKGTCINIHVKHRRIHVKHRMCLLAVRN
eukprot:gene8279-17679_t